MICIHIMNIFHKRIILLTREKPKNVRGPLQKMCEATDSADGLI
jgi:hypothetical protein